MCLLPASFFITENTMYNFTDMHLHTKFSWDAEQDMMELAQKAKERGIRHICVTEHIDFQDGHIKGYQSFDYDGYISAISRAREIFPFIGAGIEAGEIHEFKGRFEDFIKGKKFDYIIGGLHTIEGDTPVYPEYFKKFANYRDAYMRYFEEKYKLVSCGGFDAAAHLTIVHRTGAAFYPEFSYASFKNEIDDILKMLIKQSIALEVNASGLRAKAKNIIPDADVIRAYLSLGGKLITAGSDGHSLKDSFEGLETVYETLSALGVEEVAVYENREPKMVKIMKEKTGAADEKK